MRHVRGAVLAGGAALRYGGRPKGLFELGGRRILDRVVDAVRAATGAPPLLVANAPEGPTWRPDLRTMPDARPGCGSLGGIYSAVVSGPGPVLCVAWDMPFVSPELLLALVDGSTDRLGTCGYMQQKDLLMPWKRITDNVALGLIVKGTPRSEARRRAEEILERFGLGGFGHRYASEISGGMRQRAALARTFLAGDDVLLLDEPFGALDSLTRLQMQSWLLDIWQQSAASIFFITHDVDEAIRLSDRVHVLSGRPASVVLTLEIDLPRPRPYETVLTPEFAALKAQAIRYLHPDEQAPMQLEAIRDA